MLCLYEIPVVAICPVDQSTDVYEAVFESAAPIMVEKIRAAVQEWRSRAEIQEAITQALADAVGCKVTTIGSHSTVKTTIIATPQEAA